MRRCKTHKQFVDSGPYHSIMERLADFRDSIDPERVSQHRRRIALKLKTVLEAVFEVLEQHIKTGGKGVATLLYQELSGQASLACVRRFVTKCLAAEKAESKPNNYGQGYGRGGFRGRGRGRGYYGNRGGGSSSSSSPSESQRIARADVTCFNCQGKGHYKNHCPHEDKSGGK